MSTHGFLLDAHTHVNEKQVIEESCRPLRIDGQDGRVQTSCRFRIVAIGKRLVVVVRVGAFEVEKNIQHM